MCNKEQDISNFRTRGGAQKHLLKSRCNKCLFEEHKRWTSENPERVREYRDKDPWTLFKRCSRRGITPDVLIEKYEAQNECCAICNNHIELIDSAIDHNHKTGEFRGVLCKTCNRALGLFKDNPNVLMNAYNYLKNLGHYGVS